MTMGVFLERGQDLDRPLADKNRGHCFRPGLRSCLHSNLTVSENSFTCDDPAQIVSHLLFAALQPLLVFCRRRKEEHECT